MPGNFLNVTCTPDMRISVEGYGDMTEDVARALAEERHAEEQELANGAALARQRMIASEGREARTFKHGHVVGQVDARIVAYWEARYGRDFFKDRSNRRDFLKRHEECRVVAKSENPSFLSPGMPGKRGVSRRGGRWAK